MAEEKVCKECGEVYSKKDTQPWYECSGCGVYYCPDCLREHWKDKEKIKQKKEKEKMEKLAHTEDLDEYKREICPECELELAPIV